MRLTFADSMFTCSAKQVGFHLSFTTGILPNFLEGYGTKYFQSIVITV